MGFMVGKNSDEPSLKLHLLRLEMQPQALKYWSVTDIVRPIREIVRRREETTGHSVRPKWNWGLVSVRPECICLRPNCALSNVNQNVGHISDPNSTSSDILSDGPVKDILRPAAVVSRRENLWFGVVNVARTMTKLFIYCNYSILFNDLLYWWPLLLRCRVLNRIRSLFIWSSLQKRRLLKLAIYYLKHVRIYYFVHKTMSVFLL
jgi:hypothetical protein